MARSNVFSCGCGFRGKVGELQAEDKCPRCGKAVKTETGNTVRQFWAALGKILDQADDAETQTEVKAESPTRKSGSGSRAK